MELSINLTFIYLFTTRFLYKYIVILISLSLFIRFFPFTSFNLSWGSNDWAIQLYLFGDYLNGLLLGILVFVFIIIAYLFVGCYYSKISNLEYKSLELYCLFFTFILLLIQMIPSLYFLYQITSLDISSVMSVKVTGNQWYWHYQYSDFNSLEFNSFIRASVSLREGGFRLLEVDSYLVVPLVVSVRLCITSGDILHAWSVPAVGIKLDAVPGVLNVQVVSFNTIGTYYGQCSEICGANHSFIPIKVEVVTFGCYYSWLQLVL